MLKIGFLGPRGTFSEKAVQIWHKAVKSTEFQSIPKDNITQLFQNLSSGQFDWIVVPVENSIEGAVNITLDLLVNLNDICVLGEISLVVEHCLLTAGINDFAAIKKVYSHPQALAQCYQFLQNHLTHAILYQTASTAEAAKIVAQEGRDAAAISSREAAARYALKIIRDSIQDYKGNRTKFWILSKEKSLSRQLLVRAEDLVVLKTGAGSSKAIEAGDLASDFKTSLILALPLNKPGSLYKILKEFAMANINLTRIESRPAKKELGEYIFFIDFNGVISDPSVQKVLNNLTDKTVMLKLLGSYPALKEK